MLRHPRRAQSRSRCRSAGDPASSTPRRPERVHSGLGSGLEMSVTISARDASGANGRRRLWLLVFVLCGAGLLAGGWAWWTDRSYQEAMEEIETEIKAGRYAIACRELDKLLSWKSDPKGGIVYLLGSCELARGRTRAAGEAWARVVPGSAFAERAIRGRMRLLRDSGQLAAAEQLVELAAGIAAMIRRHFACCSCRSTASSAASMKQSVSSNIAGNI